MTDRDNPPALTDEQRAVLADHAWRSMAWIGFIGRHEMASGLYAKMCFGANLKEKPDAE